MKQIWKKVLSLLLVLSLLFLCVGVNVKVKAEDASLELTISNFTEISTSYKKTYSHSYSINGSSVIFEAYGVYKNSNGIQMNKDKKTYIKNTSSLPGYIKQIDLEWSDSGKNSPTIYVASGNVASTNSDSLGKLSNSSTTQSITIDASKKYNYIYFDGTTVTGACYLKSFSITIETAAIQSFVISSTKSDLMVGDTLTINKSFTNFTEESPDVVWESTDESVATISDDGVLTAVSKGTVTISAIAGNDAIESNTISVKIWPNNSKNLTTAEAKEICTFAGATNSPFDYTVEGYATTDGAESTGLADTKGGTANIDGYKLSGYDNIKKDEFIIATGKLVNYNSNNPRLVSASNVTKKYDVTFMVDGNVYKTYEKVTEGTIEAPTAPTKDEYKFLGWYTDSELTKEFDFTSIVSSNLILYAKFISITASIIQEKLDALSPQFSLGYTITTKVIDNNLIDDVIMVSDTNVQGTSYASSNFEKSVTYSTNNAKSNDNALQFRSEKSSGLVVTKSNSIAKKIVVSFNNATADARQLDIYGSNTPYITPSDLYADSTKGTLIGSISKSILTLDINDSYRYIGIRSNDGAIYVDSITITWELSLSYESNFKLRVGLDESILTVLDSITKDDSKSYECGIYVTSTSTNNIAAKTKQYAFNSETSKDGSIYYQIIDLGDMMNNQERFDVQFTIQAYAKVDDEIYLSRETKTYSVGELIKYYYEQENIKSLVSDAYDILVGIGKIK